MNKKVTQTFPDVATRVFFLIVKNKSVFKMCIFLLNINPHISLILKEDTKVIPNTNDILVYL